jgi:DNA gyrase inhibitor GyrI
VKKMIGYSLILILLGVLVIAGCKTSRAGYQSAPYRVVRAAGQFEVRDYPPLAVVETPMEGRDSGMNGSFNRLFKFITGANESKEKIAMTTPVFMTGNESNITMAFVMPQTFTVEKVPKPVDGSVMVRELPAGRFAVMRFSGGRSVKNEKKALDQLKQWMASERMAELSAPAYGYFDPPWTPGFLRRNEVMLRTDSGQ